MRIRVERGEEQGLAGTALHGLSADTNLFCGSTHVHMACIRVNAAVWLY